MKNPYGPAMGGYEWDANDPAMPVSAISYSERKRQLGIVFQEKLQDSNQEKISGLLEFIHETQDDQARLFGNTLVLKSNISQILPMARYLLDQGLISQACLEEIQTETAIGPDR